MLDNQSASNVDVTALATTLVLKASCAHRDKGVEAEVFRVDDIAKAVRSGHAAWVAVDDLNDTEVRIVEVNSEGDSLAGSILINMVGLAASRSGSTGKARNNLAEGNVSNEREAVHLAIAGEDRTNDIVEGRFRRSSTEDRARRRTIVSRNWVRGLSRRLNPLAKAAHTVRRTSTVLDGHFLVGSDGSFDVTLEFAHRLSFSLGNVGWANAGNGLLQVRHEVVAAHELDVVAKASAISKLVAERSHIGTFRNTSRHGSGKAVNSPLSVRAGSLTLAGERKERGFFWGENSKFVAEILAVRDSGTLTALGGRCAGLIGITNRHNFRFLRVI